MTVETAQTHQVLLRERFGDILLATLNRPQKGNSLNTELIDAIGSLSTDLNRPDGGYAEVKALIITGAGSRAFSSGADITSLVGLDENAAIAQMRHGQQVFDALENAPQVTIAAINGVALGGGLELAMACDLRVAAPTALLGQPEITLANLPGWGGTQRLPRLTGQGRALEMILTGDPITAAQALTIGLLNSLGDDPVATAFALAEKIVRHSPTAIDAAKQAVYLGERQGIRQGLEGEAALVGRCCASPEQRVAVQAFLDRKKAK